jgi:hypothetical protein
MRAIHNYANSLLSYLDLQRGAVKRVAIDLGWDLYLRCNADAFTRYGENIPARGEASACERGELRCSRPAAPRLKEYRTQAGGEYRCFRSKDEGTPIISGDRDNNPVSSIGVTIDHNIEFIQWLQERTRGWDQIRQLAHPSLHPPIYRGTNPSIEARASHEQEWLVVSPADLKLHYGPS